MALQARVQLCGRFAVELGGLRVDQHFPGRQGRLLFAYLVVSRPHPVRRDTLIDALWGESPPETAGTALTVLVSKLRSVLGGDVVQGRSALWVTLPGSHAQYCRRELNDGHPRRQVTGEFL